MSTRSVSPTSLRIPTAAKRTIAAAAKLRGVSTQRFMVEAALKEASSFRAEEEQLAYEVVAITRRHLAKLEEAEEREDARLADAEWERVKSGKSRMYTAKQVKRALGL